MSSYTTSGDTTKRSNAKSNAEGWGARAVTNTGLENKTTAYWRALDRAHHVHPFTNHAELAAQGVRVITRAEGAYLWDSDGNRLLDGLAGLWSVNVGYGRKEIANAAYRQLLDLPYYNTFFQSTNPPAVELAAKLAEITPGNERSRYAELGAWASFTFPMPQVLVAGAHPAACVERRSPILPW